MMSTFTRTIMVGVRWVTQIELCRHVWIETQGPENVSPRLGLLDTLSHSKEVPF
jgi:hypothetical protein